VRFTYLGFCDDTDLTRNPRATVRGSRCPIRPGFASALTGSDYPARVLSARNDWCGTDVRFLIGRRNSSECFQRLRIGFRKNLPIMVAGNGDDLPRIVPVRLVEFALYAWSFRSQ
jgi:hypothetical protein